MTHRNTYLEDLVKKYVERRISAQETEILLSMMDLYTNEELERTLAQSNADIDPWLQHPYVAGYFDYAALRKRIRPAIAWRKKITYKVVACFACVLFAGSCLFVSWFIQKPPALKYSCGPADPDTETPTGKYSCVLMIHTGCTIAIDSGFNGQLALEGNMAITKTQSGILIYSRISEERGYDREENMMNTITTARGAQYRVILPDGTKVRLNAASSIRYPVAFSGNSRNVQVTGEAFFEVAPLPGISFNAWIANTAITSLAGSFNVNAYTPVASITVISGKFILQSPPGKTELVTGNQATLDMVNNARVQVKTTDTTGIVSWKKYHQIYNHMAWPEFIADIGRRYDLDMINSPAGSRGFFSGDFCYDMPMEEALKLLSDHSFRFIRHGRKIIFISHS